MKLFKLLCLAIGAMWLVTACQKEYSVETGSLGGVAVGTMKDSLGDCYPVNVNGLFFVDSTLTDSNYVTVQVNVTAPGTYKIFTDVQNGYSFRDSGFFAAAGTYSIKLKATGRPVLPVTSDFTVTFGNSFCLFSISALPRQTGQQAVYTLQGAPASCSGAVVQGSYTTGVALNNSNTVSLQVNVTTAGSYVITTNQVNGMVFFKSGTFVTTGLQTIILNATGTPNTAGATQVPITAGGTTCSFTVNVLQGSGGNINLADSAWQFTQGGKVFHGTLDSVAFSKVNGIDVLQLYGLTFATGDSLFVLGIGMTSSTIQSGTYNTSTFAAFDFSDFNNNTIYEANPTTTGVNVAIVLTYNSGTKIASGTFSGTARSASGASVPITNGKFRCVVP